LAQAHARRSPHTRWGFWCDSKLTCLTSEQLLRQAGQLAVSLRRLGLAKGDAVVAQLPNCAEGAIAFLACTALGVKYVPVVHIYGAAELDFIIKNSGAGLLIVPAKWHNIDFAARIRDLSASRGLATIVVRGQADNLADEGGIPGAQVLPWASLLGPDAGDLPAAGIGPDDPALICYTSGTTAMPKGVVHTHRTLWAEVLQNADYLDQIENKTLFVGAPAGHIGPISMMLRQVNYDVDGAYLDRWDAAAAARLIEEFDAGWTVGVPMHLASLIPLAQAGRIPSLTAYVVGGTSVPPSLIEAADAVGIRACRSYGSTEHPTIAQCLPNESLAERSRTDGRLASGSQLRLADEAERDVAAGTPGEILSRGPERFAGYFDASLNADSFTSDGWFRTGDVGIMDAEGRLTVVDRKKDILIRGGENISAKEVEDILSRHAAVLEAAVVGWPDAAYGERVCAVVRLRAGAELPLEAVRSHFEANGVARQKTPERVMVVEDFPRNPSGKIVKAELKKRIRIAAEAETNGSRPAQHG
jgi:acyl-CoA synthetase (AMP-forming)/AMP-acid ligase II